MQEASVFKGTAIYQKITELDSVYTGIEDEQTEWKKVTPFHCPSGCGSCCVDFEPDVMEVEAIYLAAWMLHHQKERALSILDGSFVSPRPDPDRGCAFFDPESPYHCTVYGGRALICRLFGYTGDRGKDGLGRWKPCKFLPENAEDGGEHRKRQYSSAELQERFGATPPLMSDITARAIAIDPGTAGKRYPLMEALAIALRRLQLALRFLDAPPEPDSPAPDFPRPRAV